MKFILTCCSAWDYSAWVRTYALFLEERLECFRVLKYDIETDRPVRIFFFFLSKFFYDLSFLFFWQELIAIFYLIMPCHFPN